MKEIKVSIKYPWKDSDSQYYKSIVENPPKGIHYINSKKMGMITNKKQFRLSNKLKKIVRKTADLVNIPNILLPLKKERVDIIHCAHCLYLGSKPWVVDLEKYWNIAPTYKIAYSEQGKTRIKNILKRDSCKRIIAWTEAAKESIIKVLQDKEIADKITILPHSLKAIKFKKKKKKTITLLFVARYFHSKGGLQALKVIDFLTRKYKKVDAIFVSVTPKKILKKYSKNKNIKFYELLPYNKLLNEIFPSSDILIYPGFSDSFGFLNIEALAFGIPVVTVNRFAQKDLIKNGKTGFVIPFPEITYKKNYINGIDDGIPLIPEEEKIIENLIKKTSLLIRDKALRKKMSQNCLKEVSSGKFSLKKRNANLKKIYEEALK